MTCLSMASVSVSHGGGNERNGGAECVASPEFVGGLVSVGIVHCLLGLRTTLMGLILDPPPLLTGSNSPGSSSCQRLLQ